jgi:hypothetical protein
VVVDAEVSQTNKTTLRSERSGALKKRKKVREKWKKTKKGLDWADIVRDYRFPDFSRELTCGSLSIV